jgi:Fic family protein
MLTVKHIGAKLIPLRGIDVSVPDFMLKLQGDIKSSRELATNAELDQLLFDVVMGFHHGSAGGFAFSQVRDSYALVRDKVGIMGESDFLACHSVLHGTPVRSFRRKNVLVGGGDTRSASYVPPDHGSVSLLMRDWRKYVNGICNNPIAGIVVGVFRLLQIHPFPDGNGRTARLMFFALMSKYYGARSGMYDVARRMFASGNHELLLSSLRQIRKNDWSEAFQIFK